MLRISLLLLAFTAGPLLAQPGDASAGLAGRLEGRTYIAPQGIYRMAVPVLPELGGAITDTDNVVTFQDNFSVYISIGAFEQDATQRWELSTRGLKEYLGYFLDNFVMPDFQRTFPGSRVESAVFSPAIGDGAMIAYTLLPSGSMFAGKRAILGARETPVVAKRGNLIFVRNGVIFVISTELAERETEGRSYKKSTEEEDKILRDRLVGIMQKIEFGRPAAAN